MGTRTRVVSILVLSAVSAGPAMANHFGNPEVGTMLNIDSGPNPTSREIRALNPRANVMRPFGSVKRRTLSAMQGKVVIGADGLTLGRIVSVDPTLETITLLTPNGARLWFPAADFADDPFSVRTHVWTLAQIQPPTQGQLAYNR
jgi:hypothetical protein